MPISKEQLEIIKLKCHELNIKFNEGSPSTFTGSVKSRANTLLLDFEDKGSLQKFVAWLNEQNQKNKESQISASVIGGGRGGESNSYSIANLWEDVDVFIRLIWEPEIHIPEQKEEKSYDKTDADVICSIDPNISLKELNKQLGDKKYHCPILFGTLPFMSFAGGLSTDGHTAFGFLKDVVESVELLLPNGKNKTIHRNDEDFGLIYDHASLGLLGIITQIKIRVKEGAKKLRRIEEASTYSEFLDKIQKAVELEKENLNSRAIIFAAAKVTKDTPVKMTTWSWVDAETKDKGSDEKQVAATPIVERVTSVFAQNSPQVLEGVFNWFVMPAKNTTIEKIKRPEMLMGPELQVVGNLTEVGLFFDYEPKKLSAFLDRLRASLQDYRHEEKLPVNMAIFIRFPKKEDGYKVAVDFASLGQNVHLEPFVMGLIGYLQKHGMNPSLHLGKSSGIRMNQLCREGSWENINGRYKKFYNEQKIDDGLLHRKMRSLEVFSHEIKTKIDNVFSAIASKNIMRIILACGEFGETLLTYYADKDVQKILEDLKKFAAQWINKLIPDNSVFHSISAMIESESNLAHNAKIALAKGFNVFKALLNVSHAQGLEAERKETNLAIKNGIDCFYALSHLNGTTKIKHKDVLAPLKASGQSVLQKTKKAIINNQIAYDDLPRLTEFINGTASVVEEPDSGNIQSYAQNISKVFGIKREWGKFIGCAMLATLFAAIVLSSIALAITTFGVSTPIAALATSLVLSHVSKFTAVTVTAVAFVISTPSVVKFSHFSHRGRKGSIAVAGAQVGDEAEKIVKNPEHGYHHRKLIASP